MRRRFACISIVVFSISAAIALVFWPRSSAPFPFLEDKAIYLAPHLVPNDRGGSRPSYQVAYAFRDDWQAYMTRVDRYLLPYGWKRAEVVDLYGAPDAGGKSIRDKIISFSKDGKFITFYRNAHPITNSTSILITYGLHEDGVIGVTYDDYYYRPPLSERFKTWLKGIFGRKTNE